MTCCLASYAPGQAFHDCTLLFFCRPPPRPGTTRTACGPCTRTSAGEGGGGVHWPCPGPIPVVVVSAKQSEGLAATLSSRGAPPAPRRTTSPPHERRCTLQDGAEPRLQARAFAHPVRIRHPITTFPLPAVGAHTFTACASQEGAGPRLGAEPADGAGRPGTGGGRGSHRVPAARHVPEAARGPGAPRQRRQPGAVGGGGGGRHAAGGGAAQQGRVLGDTWQGGAGVAGWLGGCRTGWWAWGTCRVGGRHTLTGRHAARWLRVRGLGGGSGKPG